MTSLQLNYDFEEKLKKFIEENCPHNFSIKIIKTHSGVTIEDVQNTTRLDILDALGALEFRTDDLHCQIQYGITDEEERNDVLSDFEYLEDAVEKLRELLGGY